MSTSPFQFTRLQDGKKQRLATLQDAIGMTGGGERETWLFVSPHDDDLVIGAGLWMQAAVQAGVDVQVLVVTDGRMGYCTPDQRDRIADIRKAETYESFAILGVPREQIAYIADARPCRPVQRVHVSPATHAPASRLRADDRGPASGSPDHQQRADDLPLPRLRRDLARAWRAARPRAGGVRAGDLL